MYRRILVAIDATPAEENRSDLVNLFGEARLWGDAAGALREDVLPHESDEAPAPVPLHGAPRRRADGLRAGRERRRDAHGVRL